MSTEVKGRDERKRAGEQCAAGGTAPPKRQCMPSLTVKTDALHEDAAAGVQKPDIEAVPVPGSDFLLDTMRSVVNVVDTDYFAKPVKDSPYYDVLVMFNRAVSDKSDGKSCTINYTILDVKDCRGVERGVRAGFSTAPYEVEAVEKQREYFSTDNKLKPGHVRTVLNQVKKGEHGYYTIVTPHTYKEHPKQAQKMKGKGLGSEAPIGALYPGLELCSFIFDDGPKNDMWDGDGAKKAIEPFTVGRILMAAQREDKTESGYGLRVKKITVGVSTPTAVLFENTGAYYSDAHDVESQTRAMLARNNFNKKEGEFDNTCFRGMTKEHSQYSNPLVLMDRAGLGKGSHTLVMGADGASMELTVYNQNSKYSHMAMQVHVHHKAFHTGGACMDLQWLCSYYNAALGAGLASVVVLHDERGMRGEAGHRLQCIVLVHEDGFFQTAGAPAVDFTVPPRMVEDLACPKLAAAQKRDVFNLLSAGDNSKPKYCAWRVTTGGAGVQGVYAVLSTESIKSKVTGMESVVQARGSSMVCALREIRRLPGVSFHVFFLCSVDEGGQLLDVVQCALLQPSVMPTMPKSMAKQECSNNVGLLSDLGI